MPKRVWHNKKIVRTNNKQVWLKDEQLMTYGNDWEEVDSDAVLETYDSRWEELDSDAELEVFDWQSATEIWTVEDYQWGSEWPFIITWKNYDWTTLEVDENVEKGTIPSYDGATPEKPATAEYTYTFSWWTPAVKAAKKDATYTANFTAVPIPPVWSYSIVWEDWDGNVLQSDTVEEGVIPSFVWPTPSREGYEFIWWNPVPYAATQNQTYVAQYQESGQVNINSVYLDIYGNKSDQWNDTYNFNIWYPWYNGTITLTFNTQAWELSRYIETTTGGQQTDTITDQTVIAAYSDYVDFLFNDSSWSTRQLTLEQFNNLLDITQPKDMYVYKVVRKNTDGVYVWTFSKRLSNNWEEQVEDSFTWVDNYEEVEGQWGNYVTRTIDWVSETRAESGTSIKIMNTISNLRDSNNGYLPWGEFYNFVKYYELNTEYVYYNIQQDNNDYYSVKFFVNNYTPYYTEIGGTVNINNWVITNQRDGQTYTITGQEATDDIAWINNYVAAAPWVMTEQDYYRFNMLWVGRKVVTQYSSTDARLSYEYESFQKESYYAYNDGTADKLSVTSKASYTSQEISNEFEFDAQWFTAIENYITSEGIQVWNDLTSTQYDALVALFEQYKGSQIFQYNHMLTVDSVGNPRVLVAQERLENGNWVLYNRRSVEPDGNWGYTVMWIVDWASEAQLGTMDATQYSAFASAMSSLGYDILNSQFSQWIDDSAYANVVSAIENNMSPIV